MANPSTAVNPDLEKERKNATIRSEDFAIWWAGGYNELCKRRAMAKLFYEDPQFVDHKHISNMSHKELYEYTTEKAVRFLLKLREFLKKQQTEAGNDAARTAIEELYELRALMAGPLGSGLFPANFPLRLHFSMFLPTLLRQASDEQCKLWLDKAWNMDGIIGTYAQTELGHGTYLKGLETRADYDIEKQEFILNTPSLTAYKWWPGGLGHTVNTVVLMAQLYIKGRSYGFQPFLVRIRNEKTNEPEPGVDVGDIGPRIGANGVNNGFLGLKNVRIPLNQMLCRNNRVLPDGTFVKGPEPLLLYGTMVYVRVMIVRDVSVNLLQAATIATRYSAVRRQGVESPGKEEIQILDFLTQQHKIFPQIAKGTFYRLAADRVWDFYRIVNKELDQGNKRNLPELHALSCCLKAICSEEAAKGVEIARKACGGHGYMASANFGNLYTAATAACTYEGENTVLLLQTARFLMKNYIDGLKRFILPKTVTYLRMSPQFKWSMKLETLVTVLEITSMERVRNTYFTMQRNKNHSKQANHAGIQLTKSATMHGRAFLGRMALDTVRGQMKTGIIPKSLHEIMDQLLNIFIMDLFLSSVDEILCFVPSIKGKQIHEVEARYEQYLVAFRRNAVAVVDGFDYHDRDLASTLGCYDGRVYERLMAEARKCDINLEPVNVNSAGHLNRLMKAKL
ncbi:probable peroxisomal acyl-coenzyme A oxidase 1 [Musca vetustissima]|uniref:probable peroxisomal acyl-coenzyme A oxidase 1 n=1 Tax=Musca vetustissima TaxID=27455 RepID=UPI002AB74F62|nr:probable peroxisomal acyl-coenzyme A oxidase 1 [Musca vetustissima]